MRGKIFIYFFFLFGKRNHTVSISTLEIDFYKLVLRYRIKETPLPVSHLHAGRKIKWKTPPVPLSTDLKRSLHLMEERNLVFTVVVLPPSFHFLSIISTHPSLCLLPPGDMINSLSLLITRDCGYIWLRVWLCCWLWGSGGDLSAHGCESCQHNDIIHAFLHLQEWACSIESLIWELDGNLCH